MEKDETKSTDAGVFGAVKMMKQWDEEGLRLDLAISGAVSALLGSLMQVSSSEAEYVGRLGAILMGTSQLLKSCDSRKQEKGES